MSCPNCSEGAFLPGEPAGSISAEFQNAYFASGAGEEPAKKAVIFLTDAFGLSLKNCKIMADDFAKRLECDVWIPDYFNGKPLIPVDAMTLPDRPNVKFTLWEWIKFITTVIIPNIPSIIRNRASVVDERVASFINLLKEKKKYEKIGAVGYCFGGAICVRIGGRNLVDSIVIAHPASNITLDQIKAINVPASWECAEQDMAFSDAFRHQVEAAFAARKGKEGFVEYEFKDYKGTVHGFAARPNLSVPEIREAHKAASDQTVEWFSKTLS